MAGRFIRRMVTGGSSSASRGSRRDDEDMEGDDTQTVPIPTPRQEQGLQILLSQDPTKGSWWTDSNIKKYVTWSFTRTIQTEIFTKWSEASEAQRTKMWNYFSSHIRSIDEGYDPRSDWQRAVTRRITSLVGGLKYIKNKPDWCPVTWWEFLRDRSEKDPNWAKISKINQANRMSGAIEGKALGTHTLGRKSVSDAFNDLGNEATPYKVFEKTKKTKKGEWVNPRAKEIDTAFHEEMSQQSSGGEAPDEISAYYKAVKGYDKKSRLFGHGEHVSRRWYKPPSNKSERRSFSYNPTEVTQLSQQVNKLEGDLQSQQEVLRLQQEQFRLQQEQFAAMQAAWAEMQASMPPRTCSSIPPRRRDDQADDGHGFGDGSVEPLG